MVLSAIIILITTTTTHAKETIIESEGIYVVGANEETAEYIAKEKAKREALRNALEKTAVYVKSISVSKNYTLTSDEIEAFSKGSIKVINENFKKDLELDNSSKYICRIKALIDIDEARLEKTFNGEEKLFAFIADDLELVFKNKFGNELWISPKSILSNPPSYMFKLVLKNANNDECIVSETVINPISKLYRTDDAKLFNLKTGKFLGDYKTILAQWQSYPTTSIYGSAERFVREYQGRIADDFILNNYETVKNHAYLLINRYMKSNNNLYYCDTSYTKFINGNHSLISTFFIPDSINKINDNITKFKGIILYYNSKDNPVNSMSEFSVKDLSHYEIVAYEANKLEKILYTKHGTFYNLDHSINKDSNYNTRGPIINEPSPNYPTLINSICGFYNRYIK